MNSFTTPVAFPKPNYNDEAMRRQAMDTDPFFGWPKLPNGDQKPRFAYVPPYWILAEEFPRLSTSTDTPATRSHAEETHAESAETAEPEPHAESAERAE